MVRRCWFFRKKKEKKKARRLEGVVAYLIFFFLQMNDNNEEDLWPHPSFWLVLVAILTKIVIEKLYDIPVPIPLQQRWRVIPGA